MRGLICACVSLAFDVNAAYRSESPDTRSHHHCVPGVAGEESRSQVNVRPSSTNSKRPILTTLLGDTGNLAGGPTRRPLVSHILSFLGVFVMGKTISLTIRNRAAA